MYDSRYGSDSIHLHRKRREQEERDQIKRKKEKAAQEKVGVENLSVSQPEDASELEADSIAKKVMSGQNAEIPNNPNNGTSIQTKSDGENSGFASELQSQLSGSKGGGQALDDATRSEMESKMGADFGEVKIHTGNTAHEMNESVNAKAFTHGQDIYFRNGNYNPSSNTGKELLAHELVHTQQQGEGKVQPMIQRDHNEDEFKIYVDYKEELFQRDLAKLKDEKEIKKLTKAHKKFVKQADKFSRKMTKKSGWGATDYGTKAEDKFGDYSETIKEKKEEVKGEIAGVVLGLNGNITTAVNLLSTALALAKTDTGKAQPLLTSAQSELENARSGRKIADSFLHGADEARILGEYDKIIADYGILIQKIKDNIDGIKIDKEAFDKLMADLVFQQGELTNFGNAAAANDDVVELVNIQKTSLPKLKISVEAAISNANGAKRTTPVINEVGVTAEISALKGRSDAQLQDQAIIKEVDKLTEPVLYGRSQTAVDGYEKQYMLDQLTRRFPRIPVLAELVHDEIISATTDKEIIFVNLQKLKTQTQIDEFKGVYQGKYGNSIDADLKLKLAARDYQLALELLKMDATVGQVDLLEAAPTTDADYNNLVIRINGALNQIPADSQTVFASLIPFNRKKSSLDKLKLKYTAKYPGQKLQDDIKSKMVDAKEQSYALYLLNAPAPASNFNNAGTIPVQGHQQNQKKIKGGTVTEKAGVTFGSGAFVGGHSVDYTGEFIPDSHLLQFIWWEAHFWTSVDALGKPTGPKTAVRSTFPMGPAGNTQNVKLTAAPPPIWYVDSVSNTTAFVDEPPVTAMRNATSLRQYDKPSTLQFIVNDLMTNYAAKAVAIESHLQNYLVRDFLPVFRQDIDVKYLHTIGVNPASPTFTVSFFDEVNALNADVKTVLNADTRYKEKFSYIR